MNFDKNKINRSHSESDLYLSQFDNLSVSSPVAKVFPTNSYSSIVRRVYVEEIISSDENHLAKMRRTEFREVLDDLPCPPRIKKEKDFFPQVSHNFECEEVPMDIDNSYDDRFPTMMGTGKCIKLAPEQIVSDEVEAEIKPQERITRVIHINAAKKKGNTNRWLLLFIPLLSMFLYYYFFDMDIIVNSDVQIENIKTDLITNVHGHKPLVELIVRTLEERKKWMNKLKILSFVGSQGVGKTFMANLLKKHFPASLVHDIYGSRLHYQIERQRIVDSINSCCLNLIVIDDLRQHDNVDLFAFVHSLPKNSFILLITIFNIHYNDDNMNTIVNREDVMKIRDSFESSGIENHELLVFEDFTRDQIEDWIRQIVGNVSLSAQDEILRNVLLTHDIRHGMKGLRSKLVLELEKYKN